MLTKKGIINIEKGKTTEEQLMEVALDAGAEDIVASEDGFEITTGVAEFEKVRKALTAAKIDMAASDIMMIPSQTVAASGDVAVSVQKIIDGLEAHDDVQNVYTNADMAES